VFVCSLRRARLGSEKELPSSSTFVEERKKGPAPAAPAGGPHGRKGSFGSVGSTRSTGSIARSQSTATNSYNSTRTNSPKAAHPKSAQPETFARTDCGRFSMRTPKSPPTVSSLEIYRFARKIRFSEMGLPTHQQSETFFSCVVNNPCKREEVLSIFSCNSARFFFIVFLLFFFCLQKHDIFALRRRFRFIVAYRIGYTIDMP